MIGTFISESLGLCLDYSERLLKEITSDHFARFAAPGGVPVASNHPAFVFGHLALYSQRILTDLACDATLAIPPTEFSTVFSKDTQCQDDPFGTVYPEMDEVSEVYFRGYRAVQAALPMVDDAAFLLPNPNELMRKRFATNGSMHSFYCGGHMMMHLGQLSAWRRMCGLVPA